MSFRCARRRVCGVFRFVSLAAAVGGATGLSLRSPRPCKIFCSSAAPLGRRSRRSPALGAAGKTSCPAGAARLRRLPMRRRACLRRNTPPAGPPPGRTCEGNTHGRHCRHGHFHHVRGARLRRARPRHRIGLHRRRWAAVRGVRRSAARVGPRHRAALLSSYWTCLPRFHVLYFYGCDNRHARAHAVGGGFVRPNPEALGARSRRFKSGQPDSNGQVTTLTSWRTYFLGDRRPSFDRRSERGLAA
jgi:hypothetical protein